MVFQEGLNSTLDESLLVTEAVILLAAVFELLAFLFPIKFEIDVSGSCSYGQVQVYQLND